LRPVAAATALCFDGIQFVSALAHLEIQFSTDRLRSRFESLDVYQRSRDAARGRLGFAAVVSANTVVQILA
jgi:hypothetical protein